MKKIRQQLLWVVTLEGVLVGAVEVLSGGRMKEEVVKGEEKAKKGENEIVVGF